MPNHQIDITYAANSSLASWKLNDKEPRPIKVNPGDTLSFTFSGPGQLTDAMLMTGARNKNPEAASPFEGGTQINIDPNAELTIDNVTGVWGFSVSFTTVKDEISNFYFLPDPELEVGST